MQKNIFYIKCRASEEHPYGIKEVSADFSLTSGPTLISFVPVDGTEKDINGAINAAGKAVGFVSKPENMVELVDAYSWEDIESCGIQFLSASVGKPQEIYEKYFRPILFNSDGSYKTVECLKKDLRKINIAGYCAATKKIQNISELMEKDLINSGKYSDKEVEELMAQVCVIDVTSRIPLGRAKFTTIHMFSKADSELMFPLMIAMRKNGINVLDNGHEVSIIVEQLNNGEDKDHTYKEYFDLKGDKTAQGQVMSVVSNIILSNMIQHSMSGETLSGKDMSELSFVFNKEMMPYFNKLLNDGIVSEQEMKETLKHVQITRPLPQKYVASKDKISNYTLQKENYKIKNDIIKELSRLGKYIILDEKFQKSKDYEELTDIQKDVFKDVREYCVSLFVSLKENLGTIVSKSFENENYEETVKINSELIALLGKVKKIDWDKIKPTESVLKAHNDIQKFREGDEIVVGQWSNLSNVENNYKRNLDKLKK